jgi:predicted tellurium resistance membrane protein TerC
MDFIDIFVSLIALIILEVVLGIDNLVFLAILTEKLPVAERRKARRWGLMFAWVSRLILLMFAMGIVKLTRPIIYISQWSFSARDLFLFVGGAFLIAKATQEIHGEVVEETLESGLGSKSYSRFNQVVIQVGLMDVIFSLDSILTAVGLSNHFWVMAVAITFAIITMIFASEPIANFIHKYPTIKMLALSFLILIGMVLVADAFAFHIPRGYVYFAMGFSLSVEGLHWVKRSHHRRGRKKNKS